MTKRFAVFTLALLCLFGLSVTLAQEESSQEESSLLENYSFINTLCYCAKSPRESSESSESGAWGEVSEVSEMSEDSGVLTCFCMNIMDASNVLPPNDAILNTVANANAVTIQLGRNASDQVALVCNCAYPKATEELTDDNFLLDGYDGTAPVPANCTCVNPYEPRNYDSVIHYENITIPLLNVEITVPVPGSFFTHNFADLILPLDCKCTLPRTPYFNGTIVGYDRSFPAAACKCGPSVNAAQTEATAWLLGAGITFNPTNMTLPQLALELPAFNVSSISDITINLRDLIPSWDFSMSEMNVTVPGTDIIVKVPPFLNFTFNPAGFW